MYLKLELSLRHFVIKDRSRRVLCYWHNSGVWLIVTGSGLRMGDGKPMDALTVARSPRVEVFGYEAT